MVQYQETIWCDGCGAEIYWAPYYHNERLYCCPDCMAGRGCECGARMEFDDDRRSKPGAPSPSMPYR